MPEKDVCTPYPNAAPAGVQGETVRVVEPLQHMLAALRRVLRISADLPAGATEAGNFNLGTGDWGCM